MTKHSRKSARLPVPLRFPGLDGAPVSRSADYVAALCQVSPRTVARWRSARRVPARSLLLLQLDAAGLVLPPEWRQAGARFGPAGFTCGGYTFTPGQLAGYAIVCQVLAEYQRPPERPAGRPLLLAIPGGRAGA